ncbi:uncharacterized protein LOC111370095 [Olea europaea var. sylvestris]|uniref:uncharacterized protein LOC111370095 n=1 Tax=Olea europaea var. sylvestris TaxID=158386 RepID=UPI000C1D8C3C|nr:uncharacterized protein LOC111370095 [Olea europaea var. sylvestris]
MIIEKAGGALILALIIAMFQEMLYLKKLHLCGYLWVYKLKTRPYGSMERYKLRLVAREFSQRYGLDCNETTSPLGSYGKWVSRMLFSTELDCIIYIEQPQSFEDTVASSDPSLFMKEREDACQRSPTKVWNALMQTNLYPMEPNAKLCSYEGKDLEDAIMYRQLVGSLNYLTLM